MLLRSVATGALTLATWSVDLASVYAFTSSVPVFSQRSSQWAGDALGTDPDDTIGSSGCVVADVAMVQTAFGYPTNPQVLNHWLTEHGGYIENDLLLWRQAMAPTNGRVRWRWQHVPGIVPELRTDDQDISDRPTVVAVQSELDAGSLVVAEVRLHGHMHFVVVTGHNGDTLYINDPWFGDRTTLQARYGGYAQAVQSAQIYYPI